MKRRSVLMIIAAAIVGSLMGCANSHAPQSPLSDVLEISYVRGNTLRKSDLLEFWVTNTLKRCIVFPYDFGARIFVVENGVETIELKNTASYSSQEDIVLDPAGNLFSEDVVIVAPDYSSYTFLQPIQVVVKIRGYVCKSEQVVEETIPFEILP